MTNEQKVAVLEENGYYENPFTQMMFGQVTYHLNNENGISFDMNTIAKRNKAIISQTELDGVKTLSDLKKLIKAKKK